MNKAAVRAASIVAAWPSNNFIHDAARPTIQKQIEEAIEEAVLEENVACVEALRELEGFGPYSRQVAIETIQSRHDTEWEV